MAVNLSVDGTKLDYCYRCYSSWWCNGVDFNDNVKARFGTGNDLEIYHDGNDSSLKIALEQVIYTFKLTN